MGPYTPYGYYPYSSPYQVVICAHAYQFKAKKVPICSVKVYKLKSLPLTNHYTYFTCNLKVKNKCLIVSWDISHIMHIVLLSCTSFLYNLSKVGNLLCKSLRAQSWASGKGLTLQNLLYTTSFSP